MLCDVVFVLQLTRFVFFRCWFSKDLAKYAAAHKQTILQLALTHGAVLFRGWDLSSAEGRPSIAPMPPPQTLTPLTRNPNP